jgi:Ni/Fe-hydrogenase subunit HybB-like protein
VEGFIFPNEGVIEWDLLIVVYPFITGLVAGAFVVSSLYHVFGIKSLQSVARFSLIAALAFLVVAPLPLVIHLGRPERALQMFMTPNLGSAMSGFGYIWLLYFLLVLAEVWLVFRADIVRYAKSSTGIWKTVYSAMALGVLEISDKARAVDAKIIKVLALIGIPSAFLLHGYVGFIFGAVKANPWWSTPLMPVVFLTSAIVSGIALLIILYVVAMKLRKVPLDPVTLRSMSLWLLGILCINLVLEGLEVFAMRYESEESWTILSRLLSEEIGLSYFGIQFLLGALLPLFALILVELSRLGETAKTSIRVLASAFVLVGVFAMRWNVVIGGQLVSKSLRGFTSYVPPLLGVEGVLMSAALVMAPFVFFFVLIRLLPPWEEVAPPEPKRLSF